MNIYEISVVLRTDRPTSYLFLEESSCMEELKTAIFP